MFHVEHIKSIYSTIYEKYNLRKMFHVEHFLNLSENKNEC